MNYSKEDLEILKQFEDYFRTAVKAKYIRNLSSKQKEVLKEIYERSIGKLTANLNCGACVYNFVRTMGIKYYEDINENEMKVSNEPEPNNLANTISKIFKRKENNKSKKKK